MKLASFNDSNFVVDLEWRRLSGTKIDKELEDISRQWGSNAGVLRSISDDEGTRYQVGFIPGGEIPKYPSAAAILASIYENIILVDQLDEDLYWVCGVSEGEIVATSDVISSGEELRRNLDDIKDSFDEAGIDYRFVAPEDIADSYQGSAVNIEISDFSEILAGATLSDSVLSAAKIKPLKSRKKLYLAGAAAVVASGFLLSSLFSDNSSEVDSNLDWGSPVISKEEIQNELEKKRAEERERALAKALQQEEEWLSEILTRIDPVRAINSFVEAILVSKPHAGGWSQKAISWVSGTPHTIRRIWDGSGDKNIATPLTLRAALSDYTGIDVDLSSAGAATTHSFEVTPARITGKSTDMLSVEKNSIDHIIHTLKTAGFMWKIERKKMPRRAIPIDTANDEDKWSWLTPIKLYSLEINGTDISRFNDLKLIFHEHTNVTIKHMYYDSQSSSWQIIGDIYEYSK